MHGMPPFNPDYSRVELAAAARQRVFRYSGLCGIPSNAADVSRIGSPLVNNLMGCSCACKKTVCLMKRTVKR